MVRRPRRIFQNARIVVRVEGKAMAGLRVIFPPFINEAGTIKGTKRNKAGDLELGISVAGGVATVEMDNDTAGKLAQALIRDLPPELARETIMRAQKAMGIG